MRMLEDLEPQNVFNFFEELCKIPHGTFNTKRISDYCVAFANERNLEVLQDDANNVIIKKPGTEGYEDSEPIILQGHLDMVCEKTPESNHDFHTDGLKLYVEDGYVKARDTTLGGDDGIAIAMAMAVLDSTEIAHPPIEAVFTTDEEIGMGGANAIDLSVLKGHKLINIDSELEGILTTGCAGGISMETRIPIHREKKTGSLITIRIHGLLGGHSGAEIARQRGNAHKMMGRLLDRISREAESDLIEVNGGSKDNVISSESIAEIMVDASNTEKVRAIVADMADIWKQEFMGEEPGLTVDFASEDGATVDVCDRASTEKVISYLVICPNGLQEYSRKLEGFPETSLNIGVIETAAEYIKTNYLLRSSVETRKQQLREQVERLAWMVGGETKILTQYPAWQFDPDSELRKVMARIYDNMFGREPVISAVHAGLECGLFLGKRPDLDCVSIGPNLLDIHSFHEKLDIASTKRTWNYLVEILKELK